LYRLPASLHAAGVARPRAGHQRALGAIREPDEFRPCKKPRISWPNPDIDMIELFILDANGVPRGKLLHREELLAVYESGRPLPSTILGLTLNGDDVENSGLVWDVGDIDCRAYPLAGSLVRLPWRQIPTAAVQVSMHPSEGMPADIADPRHVLLR
jgi:glutamine synthetase